MPNTKTLRTKLSHFLGSYRGKTIFNFCYGFGASLAIMGTMFKLLHLDGANIALAIGLGTEVFIFALSAFEPPFRNYRWEEVFPILISHKDEDRPQFGAGGMIGGSVIIGSTPSAEGQPAPGQDKDYYSEYGVPGVQDGAGGQAAGPLYRGGPIYQGTPGYQGGPGYQGPGPAAFPGQGVAQEGESTVGSTEQKHPNPLANITNQQAAQSYGLPPQVQLTEEEANTLSDSIKRMGEAVAQLNNMADITNVTEKYLNQLSEMADNLNRFSNATSSLTDVSNVLLDSYRNVTENSSDISENSKGYVEQMGVLNKNLMGLNTIYEIQLKSISSQIDTIDRVNKGLLHIRDMYEGSLEGTNRFHQETDNMAENLSHLNQVYSRMLEAMIPGQGFGGFGAGRTVVPPAPTTPAPEGPEQIG
ncbi:MAG: gliding motility protein GldL [Bacteroidota bacterium]|nr:gliding motility protein GldL [Bacteroidota bacterium]